MLAKLNFGSCEELRAHGVSVSGFYKIGGALTYCSTWSKDITIEIPVLLD
jgi:hypothetical protein